MTGLKRVGWTMAMVVAVVATLLPSIGLAETASSRAGTFADGGIYNLAGGWGGSLAHRRVRIGTDINDWLHEQKAEEAFVVIQLSGFDDDDSHESLERWLEQTPLSLIDVLHFGEEHSHGAGDQLDPLYDIVKQHSDVPVYTWYSAPLGPGAAKADGYWYDYYRHGYTPFRRKVQDYLTSGKPLGLCIDASLFSSLTAAREQVMVCKEFDLPVYYFAVGTVDGRRSPHAWYSGEESAALLAHARNFVFSSLEFQRRSQPPWSLTAGDLRWGEVIEVAGDEHKRIAHEWEGVGEATVYGLGTLEIDAGVLRAAADEEVSLDYQFWSLEPVVNGRLELTLPAGAEPPRVEISRCGRADDWETLTPDRSGRHYDLSSPGREFRIRLTLDRPAAALESARVRGHVTPRGQRGIPLYPKFYNGWTNAITFKQNLDVGLWRTAARVTRPEYLEPGRRLMMRGAKGRTREAEVILPFFSEKPLAEVVVRLQATAHESLGGQVSMAVSLDGQKVVLESERNDGEYHVRLSEAVKDRPLRKFYVHIRQRNNSGVATRPSSVIHRLEVDARLAE